MFTAKRERGFELGAHGVVLACVAALVSACGESRAEHGAFTSEQQAFAYFYEDSGHIYGVSADAASVTPVVTADETTSLGPFTFDSTYLYYAAGPKTADTWNVLALPVDGSGSPAVVVEHLPALTSMAVDAASLYLLGSLASKGPTGSVTSETTSLTKVALDAREVEASTLEKLGEDDGMRALELAAFGGNVYFSEALVEPPSNDQPPSAQVRRIDAAGGELETVAQSPNLTYFAVGEDGLYYLDPGAGGVDCGPPNPTVEYVPADGSAPQQVAAGLSVQGPLAVHDGALYFGTRGKGCTGEPPSEIQKLSDPLGNAETLVAGVTDPDAFYFSGESLYFVYFKDYRAGTLAPAVTPF